MPQRAPARRRCNGKPSDSAAQAASRARERASVPRPLVRRRLSLGIETAIGAASQRKVTSYDFLEQTAS